MHMIGFCQPAIKIFDINDSFNVLFIPFESRIKEMFALCIRVFRPLWTVSSIKTLTYACDKLVGLRI